jgi:hypothetical protein
MGIKANISHLFALMKHVLDNVDDGQISVMTCFREKISYTLVFARLCLEIIQCDFKLVTIEKDPICSSA